MLERCLLIIKKRTYSALLFILNYFLFQNFEFHFHEMNLLLEVVDVLVFYRLIGIHAKRSITGLILTVELHWDCGRMAKLVCHAQTSCSWRHEANLSSF